MTDKQILELIRLHQIHEQKDLLDLINANASPKLSQSSLSRRLRNLNVKKRHGVYVSPDDTSILIPLLLKQISIAPPNLLILHTPPGHAQALAFQLDHVSANDPDSLSTHTDAQDTGFPEIIATIAGDDTIFIATHPDNLLPLKKKIEFHWVESK